MKRDGREIRTFCREVRASPGEREGEVRFGGYAAVFNSWSENLGGFRERILPGAFAKAIGRDDIRCLMNHDPNRVIGRVRAKTLLLAEDDTGLRFEAIAPDTEWARDLAESMRRGDIDQCSFCFRAMPGGESWVMREGDCDERTLSDVEMFDVSIVTYPAYAETNASVRSARETHDQALRARRGKNGLIRKKIDILEARYR